MSTFKKKITLFLAAAALTVPVTGVFGQNSSQYLVRDTRVFDIHYRLNNYNYDPTYLGNQQTVDRFLALVDSIGQDRIARIEIRSTSSPEGSFGNNEFLTQKRAKDMRFLIAKNTPDLLLKVFNIYKIESWDELRDCVVADTLMERSSIERILKVLDAENITPDVRKVRMHQLGTDYNVGNIYEYLVKTYYPVIRNSSISIVYLKEERLPVEAIPAVSPFKVEIEAEPGDLPPMKEPEPVVFEPEPEPVVYEKGRVPKETIFSLKTNLLYDVATMVNAELEIPIGRRWSFMVEDVFPWWEFSKNKYALQNWEIGFEPRFWLRPWGPDRDKMLGHFFGVYGMSGRGDLQWVNKPNYQVHYWSAGLTYGYVLPLGRNHWGNLEFSISGGFLRSDYQHYQPSINYEKLIRDSYNNGILNWWGPTKAKISLVIPINVKTQRAIEYDQTKQGK